MYVMWVPTCTCIYECERICSHNFIFIHVKSISDEKSKCAGNYQLPTVRLLKIRSDFGPNIVFHLCFDTLVSAVTQ